MLFVAPPKKHTHDLNQKKHQHWPRTPVELRILPFKVGLRIYFLFVKGAANYVYRSFARLFWIFEDVRSSWHFWFQSVFFPHLFPSRGLIVYIKIGIYIYINMFDKYGIKTNMNACVYIYCSLSHWFNLHSKNKWNKIDETIILKSPKTKWSLTKITHPAFATAFLYIRTASTTWSWRGQNSWWVARGHPSEKYES